jgi:hypothetical protein
MPGILVREFIVKRHVLTDVEASHTYRVILRDTLFFLGTSSIWAGFLPNACWPGAESNQKALAGFCSRSTSYVHGDILRTE